MEYWLGTGPTNLAGYLVFPLLDFKTSDYRECFYRMTLYLFGELQNAAKSLSLLPIIVICLLSIWLISQSIPNNQEFFNLSVLFYGSKTMINSSFVTMNSLSGY